MDYLGKYVEDRQRDSKKWRGEVFLLSRPELRRSCTITICTGAIQDSNLMYVSYISPRRNIYVVKISLLYPIQQ